MYTTESRELYPIEDNQGTVSLYHCHVISHEFPAHINMQLQNKRVNCQIMGNKNGETNRQTILQIIAI